MKRIYMDNNATTAVRPEVLDAMLPFYREHFGNPSSIHWAGRETGAALEAAREKVAKLINCSPAEIVFTSCGSEGNNLAIKGAAEALRERGNHIITTAVEHPAVLSTCKYLEKHGYEVTYLPVDGDGMLDIVALEAAITEKTILVSAMWANNETGTLFPVDKIGAVARNHGICFHTDAVQAVGRVPVDVEAAKVDLLSISGHKIGAPKGVGALYVRKGIRLVPLIHGGHQERNRRGGTHNLPGIVGLGVACDLAGRDLPEVSQRLRRLRDRLEQGLLAAIPESQVNGHPSERLPNTLNVSFNYIEGEAVLLFLDMQGIAASSGSACMSDAFGQSHVIDAMGVDPMMANSAIRFGLGYDNTCEDVDRVLEILPAIVKKLRDMSPFYHERDAASVTA
ncbi:MAG: cysteine desulfurase NifS [Syntrophotalea acetylenica]|uniref:Cysteine desulfurase IscS n=1 Tax=Syntrophotalea acetylenica TaxID=29542 RepID=A0A1L3GJD6_SYNAC|nr:cysteine desulfurase NifS [Syntrophotalea acetylenica]APG26000.1 cysteine desulfurase NifS [Syntrophotalea acetylenica]APG44066.1 cysteine desulfurase NifS [Syntrophotalea acetylenica]MDD4456521.1 cysteine desulfurase NifS [Syntrophotalea acetylenica]MDY0262933.1 cysteine desulfurase NifS [Syntrophotalea acetylenica]